MNFLSMLIVVSIMAVSTAFALAVGGSLWSAHSQRITVDELVAAVQRCAARGREDVTTGQEALDGCRSGGEVSRWSRWLVSFDANENIALTVERPTPAELEQVLRLGGVGEIGSEATVTLRNKAGQLAPRYRQQLRLICSERDPACRRREEERSSQ